jgi:hypothetical protein
MAQPAQGRTTEITPNTTVTINDQLEPNFDPADLDAGGVLEFTNNSGQDVVVELFTNDNAHKIDLSLYIAANTSVYLCNDPEDRSKKVYYNIMAYSSSLNPAGNTSGSHTIQIGT